MPRTAVAIATAPSLVPPIRQFRRGMHLQEAPLFSPAMPMAVHSIIIVYCIVLSMWSRRQELEEPLLARRHKISAWMPMAVHWMQMRHHCQHLQREYLASSLSTHLVRFVVIKSVASTTASSPASHARASSSAQFKIAKTMSASEVVPAR